MSMSPADRAIAILVELGLIKTEVHKFNGDPTVHIWLDNERFMELWDIAASTPAVNPFSPIRENGVDNLLAFPESVITESPSGDKDASDPGIPVTETTPSTPSSVIQDHTALSDESALPRPSLKTNAEDRLDARRVSLLPSRQIPVSTMIEGGADPGVVRFHLRYILSAAIALSYN